LKVTEKKSATSSDVVIQANSKTKEVGRQTVSNSTIPFNIQDSATAGVEWH